MPILGAIIAGGESRRFGRDKGAEKADGQTLIEMVLVALASQVDEVVICGRDWPNLKKLHDRPAPSLGPLGGINAALYYAAAEGFDGVLCMPVDVHPVPPNIGDMLVGPTISALEEQHLIGFWPKDLASALESYLLDGRRSVGGFLDQMGARRIADPPGLTNVNWPHDLGKLKLK